MKDNYITDIARVPYFQTLSPSEQEQLLNVTARYPFKASKHYLSLIDWKNPNDPLKRIIFPHVDELFESGSMDPSLEKKFTVQHGLQHKYPQTALLLLSDECGGICRFCFRKRLFMDCPRQVIRNYAPALEHIRHHHEITDVLISGGDPLILPTVRLSEVIREVSEIDHVSIIRIGTKMLAYNPYRITQDPSLCSLISTTIASGKQIYLMAHFNHPAEISPETINAIQMLQQAGAVIVNQTPVIDGVNADPVVMTVLFRKLASLGISPYYVFQCRPTTGNYPYAVPVEKAYGVMHTAFQHCSGLSKRARFIMSHSTGKIEVVGKNAHNVFMRYHQAANPDDYQKFMITNSNPQARWFDDYQLVTPASRPIREWLFESDSGSGSETATL